MMTVKPTIPDSSPLKKVGSGLTLSSINNRKPFTFSQNRCHFSHPASLPLIKCTYNSFYALIFPINDKLATRGGGRPSPFQLTAIATPFTGTTGILLLPFYIISNGETHTFADINHSAVRSASPNTSKTSNLLSKNDNDITALRYLPAMDQPSHSNDDTWRLFFATGTVVTACLVVPSDPGQGLDDLFNVPLSSRITPPTRLTGRLVVVPLLSFDLSKLSSRRGCFLFIREELFLYVLMPIKMFFQGGGRRPKATFPVAAFLLMWCYFLVNKYKGCGFGINGAAVSHLSDGNRSLFHSAVPAAALFDLKPDWETLLKYSVLSLDLYLFDRLIKEFSSGPGRFIRPGTALVVKQNPKYEYRNSKHIQNIKNASGGQRDPRKHDNKHPVGKRAGKHVLVLSKWRRPTRSHPVGALLKRPPSGHLQNVCLMGRK